MGVAPLGIPPHGSSPATVWCLAFVLSVTSFYGIAYPTRVSPFSKGMPRLLRQAVTAGGPPLDLPLIRFARGRVRCRLLEHKNKCEDKEEGQGVDWRVRSNQSSDASEQ